MKEICNDNLIYYYLLNSNKIIKSTLIVVALISMLIIIGFITSYQKNKKNNKLKSKIIKSTILLVVIFLIPLSLSVFEKIASYSPKYKNCLENEELEALKKNPTKGDKYVEIKKEDNKSTDPIVIDDTEVIEIIEHPQDEEKEETKENSNSENEDEEEKKNDDKDKLNITNKDNAIYFLNVGAGTDAIIIQDDGHFGLIDTSYNSKASYIVKQLKKLGAKYLDFIIITHAHLDHIGGYKKIISKIPVDTLYIKVPGNVNSNYIPTYYDLIDISEAHAITICDVADVLCQDLYLGNIHIKLFNTEFFNSKGITNDDRTRVENSNSITALATINNKKVYLASDIGDYFDNKVETRTSELVGDVDVYKVSHHGYVSFNNNIVSLSYLKPEYNIITNTKQLSLESVRRLKNTSPDYKKTYYTPDGTVTLHITNEGEIEINQ